MNAGPATVIASRRRSNLPVDQCVAGSLRSARQATHRFSERRNDFARSARPTRIAARMEPRAPRMPSRVLLRFVFLSSADIGMFAWGWNAPRGARGFVVQPDGPGRTFRGLEARSRLTLDPEKFSRSPGNLPRYRALSSHPGPFLPPRAGAFKSAPRGALFLSGSSSTGSPSR